MYIKKIDKDKKEIMVAIPLTTSSGKIRVKERDKTLNLKITWQSLSVVIKNNIKGDKMNYEWWMLNDELKGKFI